MSTIYDSNMTTDAITSEDEAALNAIEMLLAEEETEKVEHEFNELEAEIEDAEIIEVKAEEKEVKPKKIKTAGLKPSEALLKKFGDKIYETVVLEDSEADLSEADLKTSVNNYLSEFDDAAKKVGEKIVNVLQTISGEGKLSTYTEIAIKLLKENGETSSVDIRNAYLDHPYKVGTANAQSSQMMKLLPLLKLANREGNKLIANENSTLLSVLCN